MHTNKTATANIDAQFLKYAVTNQIFCRYCGIPLKCATSVLVEAKIGTHTAMAVYCVPCWDGSKRFLRFDGLRVEVTDGRELHRYL